MSTANPEVARAALPLNVLLTWRDVGVLMAVAILGHVLVLANPGFFNHDEWQRLDEIERFGFWDYIARYSALHPGPDFGFPVRPLGFVQQGISALYMRTAPVIPHLIDVLLHAVAVLQVMVLGRMFGASPSRARWAALLFSISPLATTSVGWVGASFDRWYVVFVLTTLIVYLPLVRAESGQTWRWPALLASSAAAIVSKETAMALPGLLVLVVVWMRGGSVSRLTSAGQPSVWGYAWFPSRHTC